MERRILDTNVIVRHLVGDDKPLAAQARKLFARCDHGELALVVLSAVVAETVFVLDSFYQHPRAKIARIMKIFLTSPGVELTDLDMHLAALNRYGKTRLHFVDCLIAEHAAAHRCAVASFDKDLRKITGEKA
jgi:predicted nucleic acid-binding protein